MPPSDDAPATGGVTVPSHAAFAHSNSPATTQWDLVWSTDAPLDAPSVTRREEIRSHNYRLVEDRISSLESQLIERELLPAGNPRIQQTRVSRFKTLLMREEEHLMDYTPRVSAFNARLPYEAIIAILGMVVFEREVRQRSVAEDFVVDAKLTISRIRTLRLVCPHWNAVILTGGEFWTSAFYELPIRTSLSGSQWLSMCSALDRRRNGRPLHLVLQITEDSYMMPERARSISSAPEPHHACSRRELAAQEWEPVIDVLQSRADSVTLDGGQCTPSQRPPYGFLPRQLWSLKRLVLRDVYLQFDSDQLYLCETPNLEELWIDTSFMALPVHRIEQLRDNIRLTSLRHFSYSAPDLLDPFHIFNDPFCLFVNVALPSLQHITLACAPGNGAFPEGLRIESVCCLELGPYWNHSPTRVVAALPSLEKLVVDGFLGRQTNDQTNQTTSEFLFIGHFMEMLGTTVLAPKLKTVCLMGCVFTPTNVLTLLKGWRRHGCLHSRMVTFTDCHLSGAARPQGKIEFLQSLLHLYAVEWRWNWDNPVVGTPVFVKVDEEDLTAEEEDEGLVNREEEA